MEKILVPTDFSEEAENALKVAAQLAKKYDAEIFLMNMLEFPADTYKSAVNPNEIEQLPESLFFMKMARKRFDKLLNQDFLKGVKITQTVEFRKAFDGIIDGVNKYNIDLIVMGSAGASGISEIFIGSNTEKVVRHSKIPVLVIKEAVENFKVNNFVFATDLEDKRKQAFWKALKLANEIDAKLHVVYVNTLSRFNTTNEIEKKIESFTADAPLQNFTTHIYNAHSIEEGILKYAKKVDADLMGIATSGRKGLAHLLNGSISQELVNHAKKPVITFRM